MRFSYENQLNTVSQLEGTNVFNWKKESNGKSFFDANVIFGIEDLPEMKILESTENSFVLAIEDKVLFFDNIVASENTLSFLANGSSNRMMDFSLTDPNFDFNIFMEIIQSNSVINAEQKIWPFIFIAACLIGSGVDYYCDGQVADGVSECTRNGMCSRVLSCGAECVPCGSQK